MHYYRSTSKFESCIGNLFAGLVIYGTAIQILVAIFQALAKHHSPIATIALMIAVPASIVAAIWGIAMTVRYGRARKEATAECAHGVPGGLVKMACTQCQAAHREAEQQRVREQEERARQVEVANQARLLECQEMRRLSSAVMQSHALLCALTPRQFEDAVAEMFRCLGFKVHQTPYSNDKGRDAIVSKDGERYLVECKHYAPSRAVGRRDLQILIAAMNHDRVNRGFLVTTGKFAKTTIEYARPHNVELIDMSRLIVMMASVAKGAGDASRISVKCASCGDTVICPFGVAASSGLCREGHTVVNTKTIKDVVPDSTSQICESCGRTMRPAHGRYGRYWRCSGYPACHGTANYGKSTHS